MLLLLFHCFSLFSSHSLCVFGTKGGEAVLRGMNSAQPHNSSSLPSRTPFSRTQTPVGLHVCMCCVVWYYGRFWCCVVLFYVTPLCAMPCRSVPCCSARCCLVPCCAVICDVFLVCELSPSCVKRAHMNSTVVANVEIPTPHVCCNTVEDFLKNPSLAWSKNLFSVKF